MNASKFILGLSFILAGLVIASFVNYLDMSQFETRIDAIISARSASEVSGVRRSIESKDVFSQKYISPELSSVLLRDYSSIDLEAKSILENIRDSVSQKKATALRSIGLFLFLTSLSLMNYSIIRKSENKKSALVGVSA
jgi:hypothetical protein